MDCSYFSGDQRSRILPDTLCGFLFYSQLNLNIVSPIVFTVAVTYDERRDYERDISFQRNVRKCHSVNSIGNKYNMSETISFRHIIFMFISYCLIIIALVQRLQRSVGHQQPPSAACTAYVCSSGVYSLYWIKGNNVAWFYVETNMRLNRIRHRHYPLSNTLTK